MMLKYREISILRSYSENDKNNMDADFKNKETVFCQLRKKMETPGHNLQI